METMRLRTIQQPSQLDALLESFVRSRGQVPADAHRVLDRSELPGALQRVAIRARKSGHAWAAWGDGPRLWFFTAEMSLDLSRERGQPVLQVTAHAEDGQIVESGPWVRVRDGQWQRASG